MRKTTLHIAIIIYILLFCPLFMLATPRLSVVVIVDGLNQESLDMMQPYWQQGGLRMLSEDAMQASLTYPHSIYGGIEEVATLLTGEIPSTHGISMSHFFSRTDRLPHPILQDATEHGIGAIEGLSPRNIKSPTLSDYFRLTHGKDARIFAIGQDAQTAILMAGHAADACCWMNLPTEKWATTSYYPGGLPTVADEMNIGGRIQEIISSTWTPRMTIGLYNHPTDTEIKKGFSYPIQKNLMQSPAINTLTIELALHLQEYEQLGKDIVPDLLLLQLTARTPHSQSDLIRSAEQEDQYLWLNQDLGYLIEQLQKRVGEDQLQIILVGTPCMGLSAALGDEINMPIKSFNVERAAALTGAYLMALHGHERWVDGGYGQSIFLNRDLIEQKHLSLIEIQQQVAYFLMNFEGIQVAYPMLDAYHDERLNKVLNKQSAGDVVFLLQEGWQLTWGEDDEPIDKNTDRNAISPLLIWPQPEGAFDGIKDATDLKKLLN